VELSATNLSMSTSVRRHRLAQSIGHGIRSRPIAGAITGVSLSVCFRNVDVTGDRSVIVLCHHSPMPVKKITHFSELYDYKRFRTPESLCEVGRPRF